MNLALRRIRVRKLIANAARVSSSHAGAQLPGRRLALLMALVIYAFLLASCTAAAPAKSLPFFSNFVPAATTTVAAPTATSQPQVVVQATASPTAASTPAAQPTPLAPSPTATTVPPEGSGAKISPVQYFRETLPNGVVCPLRNAPVPQGVELIGRSAVCRLPIISYQLGEGETPLVLVGGMHGGYEWNTILLANLVREYLEVNPDLIPPSLTIYVVPNANPDGLYAVTHSVGSFERPENFEETIPGRFNGREVDLNRNWDCEWAADALWGTTEVSGGTAPFSEPETRALGDYLLEIDPAGALFWHSAASGVYASGCRHINRESRALAEVYGQAADYEVYDHFDRYTISGDASSWVASQGIPSITVELTTHETLDWEKNLAGLDALMDYIPDAAINRQR